MAYRSTPLQNSYSPAELLMGRRICTTVPVSPDQLKSKVPDYSFLAARKADMREKQKQNFDKRHQAQDL